MTPPGEAPLRSGLVAILGRPNVGKSTLLNRLVGRKVAITSPKPQTTRNRIAGVLRRPGAQVVLLDTPGLHKPRHRLGEYMVAVARRALEGVDAVLLVVDGAAGRPGPGDREAAAAAARAGVPVLLAVNKADLARPEAALAAYADLGAFAGRFAVSALTGEGCDALAAALVAIMPEGPPYFPDEDVTDQPEETLVAELIREKILHLTREEVPHAVAVQVERLEERENGLLHAAAVIFVERESQKGILIGKGGGMLREIGRRAREELEGIFGTRVFLDLWVKVKEDWRNRAGALDTLGYRLEE